MITFEDVKENEEIKALITASSNVLKEMNYTEHGLRHATYVSRTAHMILAKLGFDEKTLELAKIAGYVHDIGNAINRKSHGITSAVLLYGILKDMHMPYDDICEICSAVGNHEEEIGWIVNSISAALIIADKSDAHRTRVLRVGNADKDIHDLVNNAISKNIVLVDGEKKII
ncbi:MAG: HD domain-containing protein, partial [Clostridia bacterium]